MAAVPPSLCEARAVFVLDASMSPGCFSCARLALERLGGLLAVAGKTPPSVGVALLASGGGAAASSSAPQLMMQLRPGPSFQLVEFQACVWRLGERAAASGGSAAPDGGTLGSAVTTLLRHCAGLPGRPDAHNHVVVVSTAAFDRGHARLHKVAQWVGLQPHASLHFVHLTGAEREQAKKEGEGAAPAPTEGGAEGEGDSDARGDFVRQCATGYGPRVTFDSVAADCGPAADALAHAWLAQLTAPPAGTRTAAAAPNEPLQQRPDVVVDLGAGLGELPCRAQQPFLPLPDAWLVQARACPCHNVPMAPPTGAAAAAAAADPAADPGAAAALVALPEALPWRCQVGQHVVSEDAAAWRAVPGVLQLGRHTQLRQAAAAPAAPQQQLLALPAGEPCRLTVRHVVPLSQVDALLVHGQPLVLSPALAAPAAAADGSGDGGDTNAGGSSADAPLLLMRALCQELHNQQEPRGPTAQPRALLASSQHDCARRISGGIARWYLLQPSADGGSLLLRCVASREQMLPPLPRRGGTAAADEEEGEDEVRLFDAGQAEAVRGALAALPPAPGDEAAGAPLLLPSGLHEFVSAAVAGCAGPYAPPPPPPPPPPAAVVAAAPAPAQAAAAGRGQPAARRGRRALRLSSTTAAGNNNK